MGTFRNSRMSDNLTGVFEALCHQFQWLHVEWKIYRQLYWSSPERIDLLNNAASLFFRVCQDALLNDILLALTRLTDNAETRTRDGRKENLTLNLFAGLIKQDFPNLESSVNKALGKVDALCGIFRIHRNLQIAHNDLATVLGMTFNPLPGINYEMIDSALKSIETFLNLISVEFGRGEIGFEYVVTQNDGESILVMLKEAQAYRKHEQEGIVDALTDGVYL